MKNKKLFFNIILYWAILLVTVIFCVFVIEGITDYRFDAQLGMAIVLWGVLVSLLLAIMGAIHNLILFIIRKAKRD
jgi:hypothetical protein